MCTKCKPLFADVRTAIGASARARVAPYFSAVMQPTLLKLTDYALHSLAYIHKQTEHRMHDQLLRQQPLKPRLQTFPAFAPQQLHMIIIYTYLNSYSVQD
jgi:hypothetical protein